MTRYYLAPYVRAHLVGDTGFFSVGSLQQHIQSPTLWKALVEVGAYAKEPRSKEQLLDALAERLSPDEQDEAWKILAANLIRAGIYDREDAFSRTLLYYNMYDKEPDAVLRRLSTKHVMVLGCGGIGNHIALHLAGSGVGALTLVDDDIIEQSNLGRQFLFSGKDLGKKKVHAAAEALSSRYPSLQVGAVELAITGSRDLKQLPETDLIVVSADHPMALIDWVNEFSIAEGTPYINVGYIGDIAAFGPLVIPGQTGCFRCGDLAPTGDKASHPLATSVDRINAGGQAASTGPINAVAAAMAANDCLRFLGDFGEPLSINRRVGVWTDRLQIQCIDTPRNVDCKVCGHAP